MMWGVEGDAVDDRGDEAGVGNDLTPLAERQVGGDGDGGFLFSFGEDLEEELAAAAVELDVAEFIEAQQVEALVPGDDATQAALVGGLDKFVDELRSRRVADAASLFAGGHAHPDEQVALAGAAVAQQHNRLTGTR